MSDASIADLLATIRALIAAIPVIIAAVGLIFTGWQTYKIKMAAAGIGAHLVKQDATAAVAAEAAVITAKVATADNPDDQIRARVASLADDIKAIREAPGPGA